VSLTYDGSRPHPAQGGVTLGLEQGDLDTDFPNLWHLPFDPHLIEVTGMNLWEDSTQIFGDVANTLRY
jgi:hypothetical protein